MTPAWPAQSGSGSFFVPADECTRKERKLRMQSNVWLVAALWMGLALVASVISIRIGISVALIEIIVGIIAGNFFGVQVAPWIDFLATFGSGLLTFLAGAEIDPVSLRRHLKPALAIGAASFFLPFLAACFVTDFGTVLALGVIFGNFNAWLLLFVAVTAIVLWYLPAMTRFVIRSVGHRISETEVKFIFFVLFLLGGLANLARSEAVLAAYLVGLVIAGVFVRDRVLMDRMRAIAFALLTPFYFIKADLFVSLPAVVSGAALIFALLAQKMVSKGLGVWPLTKAFRIRERDGIYTPLLMSTGLTFGTISALFGLTTHVITQQQYPILVTTVIGSAIVPTVIAQRLFQPELPRVERTEEDVEILTPAS
jgi:Kef-type K+ transport system membrane component KefB